MKKTSQPIVFFGSGPVAAKSLELLANNFVVEAVVTKPKPAHHRGNFPVLDVAEHLKVPVHTVSTNAELSKLVTANLFMSKLAILVDFGMILGQDMIDYFPLGIVNSHFALLPEWRGADPITFAILSGQPKTGVSLKLIDAGLDTGKILAQKSLPISQDATAESLTAELIDLSDELLIEFVPKYIDGSVKPRSQPHPERATYSRKLTKADGVIDWAKPAVQIEREIRAFAQWPKSSTQLASKDVIITGAHVESNDQRAMTKEVKPGTVVLIDTRTIGIMTGKDLLVIDRLKPAGKKEMTAQAFLAGHSHLF